MSEPSAPSEATLTKLRRLVDRKREKRLADDAKKKADAALELEMDACYEELEELFGDKPTFTFDLGEGYGRQQFSCQEKVYHTIYSKNRALESLDEEALSDEATRPDFNGTFLNQLVQERIKNGQDLPEGVGFRSKRWITLTQR